MTSLPEYMRQHPERKKKAQTLAEYMRQQPAPKEEPSARGYRVYTAPMEPSPIPKPTRTYAGAGVTPPPKPKVPARAVGPGYVPRELERYRELRGIEPPPGEEPPWTPKGRAIGPPPGKPPKLPPEAAEPVLSRARSALGKMFTAPLHELDAAAKPWGVIRDIAKGFATFPFHLAKAAAHDIANKAPDETLQIASDWLWGTWYTGTRPREWLPKQLGGRGTEYSVEGAIGDILVATLVGRGLLKGRAPLFEEPAPKYTLAPDLVTGEAKIMRLPVEPGAVPPLSRRPWEIPTEPKPPGVPAIERAKVPGRKTLEELRAEIAEPKPTKPTLTAEAAAVFDMTPEDFAAKVRGAEPAYLQGIEKRLAAHGWSEGKQKLLWKTVEVKPPTEPVVSAPDVIEPDPIIARLTAEARRPSEAGRILVRRPPKPEAMEAAEELTKGTIRTHSAQTMKANLRADKWAREVPEAELEDITAVVEKTGNPLIEGDTLAAAKARLTAKGKAVLKEYPPAQEQARNAVNDYMKGVGEAEYIKHLDDYVPHFYTGWTKATKNRFLKNSPNARQRKIPTLKEAVEEYGLTPITLNVAKLHKMWAEVNWRVATNRRFLHELRKITTEDGTKVVKTKDAPADWVYFDHPLIRRVWGRKTAEGKLILREGGVWIHPDAAQAVKQIVQQPFSGNWVRGIETFNGFAKEASLSLTLFHHGALTESAQAVLARIFNPVRGLLVVGEKAPVTGRRVIAARPHRLGVGILEAAAKDPKAMAIVEDALNHGLQLGRRSSDVPISRIARQLAGLEAKMRKIPVLGQAARRARQFHEWYHKILWDRYHAGLKLYSYYDIVGDQIARYGPGTKTNQSVKAIKETLAAHLNDAYGGQEWGAKFWMSPRGLQIARMTFLAPDWTLSAASVAAKTFTKDPALRRLQIRYWRNMIPTLMGSAVCAQYAVHQFAEQLGNDPDHQEWCIDNEKGHAWDIDVTPIVRALPWHDPDDKTRYYTHFGKQAREVLRWPTDPLMQARRKSSPAVQVAAEQIFDTQGGGWDMPWAEQRLLPSVPERAKAVAAKLVPFSFRGSNFMLTAPLAKGMTRWKASVALDKALESYANPTMWPRASRHPQYVQKLDELVGDILDAAELNDVDTKKAMQYAMARVRSRHYRAFFAALDNEDGPAMDKSAKAVVRLHAGMRNLLRSAKARDITLTPEERRTLSTAITEARETLGVTPRTYQE